MEDSVLTPKKCLFSKKNFCEKMSQPIVGEWAKFGWAFILTWVFWAFQRLLPIYTDTDNYWFAIIFNGLYGTKNYCIYLSPLISKIVQAIDSIFVHADGFYLLADWLTFLASFCILYYAVSSGLKRINVILTCAVMVSVNMFINIAHANFTIFTGFLVCVSYLPISSFLRQKTKLWFAFLGILLFVFGMLWRFDAMLLTVPYAGLMVLTYCAIHKKEKEKLKKYLKRMFCLALILLLAACSSYVYTKKVKSIPEIEEDIEFSRVRSAMGDYNKGNTWDDVQEELTEENFSQNDYFIAKKQILIDNNTVDYDFLHKIAIAEQNYKSSDLKEVFLDDINYLIYYLTLEKNIPIWMEGIFCLLLFAFIMLRGSKKQKIGMIICALGTLLIFIGLFIKGRIPPHVLSVLWMCVFVYTITVLSERNLTNNKKLISVVVISLTAFLFFIGVRGLWGNLSLHTPFEAKSANVDDFVNVDNNKENYYIWSALYFANSTFNSFWSADLLPSDYFLSHNFEDGGIIYDQPCYDDFLEKNGIDNLIDLILEKDNCYYVADKSRCDVLLQYIREHYDENAQVKLVDVKNDWLVWKFCFDK